MEEKKKRQKRSYYFIAQNPLRFGSVKEAEAWIEANGKKQDTVIIFGEPKEHNIIQKVKIHRGI